MAITIDNLADAASPKDINVDLSKLGDYFWKNLQGTSGLGLRVTQGDGVTLEAFERTGWSYANRTGILEVNDMNIDADAGMNKAWLYFDNTNASIGDGSTTEDAASGPLTASMVPRSAHRGFHVLYRQPRRGATKPRTTVIKGSEEELFIYWDFGGSLAVYGQPHNGARTYEEIVHATFIVTAGGNNQAALYTAADTRFIGTNLVRTTIKAGSSGTDYTPSVTVKTSLGRILNARCLLKVQDVDET
tara:strand:- start:2697 stop:3434 length:738 start_codon:yes stop_codon:yes gene_type:complete